MTGQFSGIRHRLDMGIVRLAAMALMAGPATILLSVAVNAGSRPPSGRAAGPADDVPVLRAELLVFDSRVTSKTEVGIHLTIRPGWYIYWSNPGDAGLAPALRWRLPAGFEAGAARYPVPEKIRYGDLVVFGFHDELLILVELSSGRPPGVQEKAVLGVDLDWMVCRESCLVGRESLTAAPAGLGPADLRRARDIRSRFSARFPKPADDALRAAAAGSVARSPRGWTVEIAFSGEASPRVRDFYPHPVDGFVVNHARISVSGGRVRIPLVPSSASARLTELGGVLVVDSAGYELRVPLGPKDDPGANP